VSQTHTYSKIFSKIVDSSIWLEDTPTRLLWMMMIAVMDEHGFCQFASVGNLAHRARLSIEETERALAVLEAPDPDSANPANEGRRVSRVDGGWLVLNAQVFRDIVLRQQMTESQTRRTNKWRERKKLGLVGTSTGRSRKFTPQDVASMPAPTSTDSDAVHKRTQSTDVYGVCTQAEARAVVQADHGTYNKPVEATEVQSTSAPPSPVVTEISTRLHNAPRKPTARGKTPIYRGERIVVFDWMLDDLRRMLGEKNLLDFNIDEWFYTLDRRAMQSDLVIPDRDGGAWLKAQTLEEAQRRGLVLASMKEQAAIQPGTSAADLAAHIREHEGKRT
jgi:hypothetical protein